MQAKLCVNENIPVIPIPGPSAFVAALSASGLDTDQFTFGRFISKSIFWFMGCLSYLWKAEFKHASVVGFLPKHAGSRKERLMVSANEATTQVFYVPPHKLRQFLEESSLLFGDSRYLLLLSLFILCFIFSRLISLFV